MHFTITGSVDIERIQGKFVSRDEIEGAIREALDDALGSLDLSGLGPDCDSEYEATDYGIEVGR
jgi:hypothetical protein